MDDTIAVRILFSLPLLLVILDGAGAREIPLPEEEAAPAIFSTQLGESDTQLFLEGSWESELLAGFGYTFDERTEELYSSTLPQLSEGIAFSQTPDITLSLWLRERYFFETVITEEQQLETFLFGYNGNEGDAVEKVRIGNSDLGTGDFGYLSLPAASSDSFGAYGLFNGSSSTHHLALRYDPAGRAHKAYLGRNLIEEERLAPEEYLRGRFFVLPDAGVENLRVFMEDADGSYDALIDGTLTTFRELGSGDMSVSAAEGVIYLNETADSRVAVRYEKNGESVGAAGLGNAALAGTDDGADGTDGTSDDFLDLDEPAEDFAWSETYLGIDFAADRRVEIDGTDCLLLHVPGEWSPFEMLSVYRPESRPDDPERLQLHLAEKEARGGERVDALLFRDELIRLPAGSSLRDPAARYPLAAHVGDEAAYYGPSAPGRDPAPARELLVQTLSPVSGFLQETSALAGSIEVLRDGRRVSAYSFDPATGEVSFFYPVGENERIDIYYRSPEAASPGSGDLLFASANRFSFTETWSGRLDAGLRWNAGGQSYTAEQGEAEGSVLTSAGVRYEGEHVGASLQGALGVNNPNTTGYRRLLGMGEEGIPVPLLSEGLYPAPPLPSLGLSHPGGRGELLYRDYYRSSFAGGQVLQPYVWDPPSEQVYGYGERIGPYLAATGSETAGNAAVFDYRLENGEWAGGMVPLVRGEQPLDLSSRRALTFRLRHIAKDSEGEPEGEVTVHLVFGLLPEDLDADSRLDKESGPLDDGFPFDHSGYGTMPVAPALPWAPDRATRDSEDLNGNGLLNGRAVTVVKTTGTVGGGPHFTLPEGGDGFRRIRIPLSPADREKLTAVTAVALYIEESGPSSDASGRLLLADPSFAGGSFTVSPGDTGLTVGTRLLDAGESSYEQLLSFDDAARFNGSSPVSVPVSRAEWEDPGIWSAVGYFPPADLKDYRTLSFYLRNADGSPGELQLKLSNHSGEGLGVRFTPSPPESEPGGETGWHRYSWNLETGEVNAGGRDQEAEAIDSGGGFTVNPEAADVTRFTLEASPTAAGAFELDEVHLREPRTSANAGGRGELTWSHSDPLLSAGETPVLHGVKLQSSLHAETGPLAAGFSAESASRTGSENLLSFSLFTASADLRLDADLYGGAIYATGGYSVSLPLAGGALTLTDSYNEGLTGTLERSVSRSSGADLRIAPLETGIAFELDWDGDELTRQWNAALNGSFTDSASASASLDLAAYNPLPRFDLSDPAARFRSSYPLYLFSYTGGAGPERSTRGEASFELGGERLTLYLSDTVSSRTESAESYLLSAKNVLSADLFFTAGEGGGSRQYSLGYSRDFDSTAIHGGALTYPGDAQTSLRRVGNQDYLWIGLPVLELWDSATRSRFTGATAGYSSASYESELRTEFGRSPGSTLLHLLLPGHFHASVMRELEREQGTVRDSLELEGNVRATALNLFGELGRYPLFPWYRTEEISHSLGYTALLPLTNANGNELEHTVTVQQYLDLQVGGEDRLTWDARWDLVLPEETHELSLTAEWRHSPGRVAFPRFLEMLKEAEQPRLVHTEQLDVFFSAGSAAAAEELRPLLRHTTEFVFDEIGSIGITAALGYMRRGTEAAGKSLHTFGGEAGITADFSF